MKTIVRTIGLLIACSLLWALSPAAQAQLPWQPAATISETGEEASQARVATGPDGTTVVAWTGSDGGDFQIRVRLRQPGEPFGAAQTLNAPGTEATHPRVAVGPGGLVAVAWLRKDGTKSIVQIATGTGTSGFSEPITLSDTSRTAKDLALAMGPDGTVLASWASRDEANHFRVQASVREPGGAFDLVANLSESGFDAERPQVAVGPDGTATVVWQRSGGELRVQASTRYPQGTFGPPEDLSEGEGSAFDPRLTTEPDGDTTVVWRYAVAAQTRIQAITRPVGDSFGDPEDLSTVGQVSGPHIGSGADGTSAVAWSEFDGSRNVIQVSERPDGGSFTEPVELAMPLGSAVNPLVAVTGDGGLEVSWLNENGTTGLAGSYRENGGSFSEPALISSGGEQVDEASIAAGPQGEATTLVWRNSELTIRFRSRDEDGELGSIGVLSSTPADAEQSRVTLGSDGTAHAIWVRTDGPNDVIRLADRPVGGTYSAPLTLSEDGVDAADPDIAVGAEGTVAVTWQATSGLNRWIQARVIAPTGAIGPVVDLTPTTGYAEDPQAAVDAAGNVTVVWERGGVPNRSIQFASRPAGGAFSGVQAISSGGADSDHPRVATGPDGSMRVVWRSLNGPDWVIETATRAPGGSFSAPLGISQAGQDADVPDLAIGPDGTAVVTWLRSDGSHDLVQTRTAPPGASFSSVETLSPAGANTEDPKVAIGADGSSAISWVTRSGPEGTLLVRVRPVGGTFEPPIEAIADAEALESGGLVVGPDGETAAIWSRDEGGHTTVESADAPLGQGFDAADTISPGTGTATAPDLAVSPDGSLHSTWTFAEGSSQVIQAASTGRPSFPLTVSVEGTEQENAVYTEPFGVVCPGLCEAQFGSFTKVTIHAEAPIGYLLVGWTGACSESGPTCVVTMDKARTTTAIFAKSTFVSVQKTGSGEGTVTSAPEGIDCGPNCAENFISDGTTVLTASPEPGSVLVQWGGACVGSAPTCVLNGHGPHYVVANFAKVHSLTVNRAGDGAGTVKSAPAGIDCGPTCEATYGDSQTVTLTAEPEPGSTFEGWTGPCSTSAPTCDIRMSETRNVTATFSKAVEPKVCPPRTLKPGKRKLNRKKGTTTLAVRAGGAGTVVVPASRNLRRSVVKVNRTGKGRLTLKLKGKAAKKLKRKRRASVKVRVTYRPGGGCPAVTRSVGIKFALRR